MKPSTKIGFKALAVAAVLTGIIVALVPALGITAPAILLVLYGFIYHGAIRDAMAKEIIDKRQK